MKMKHLAILSLFTLHSSLFTLSAAVPLKWTVETSRATPAQFEAYQGETIAFEAALQSYGKPLEAPSNYSFFWQTNGMGSTYWEKKVVVGSRSRTEEFENSIVGLGLPTTTNPGLPTTTNVLFATWSPDMDVGAKVYSCFIGQPGTIYHAAFQLRLRPSPGATPNELPLPQKVIDFAKVTVLNPPWGAGGIDTNAVRDIVRATVDGAARPLPKYLHERSFDSSYPDEAQEYYRSRGNGKTEGGCSSVREGGFLYRNFDYPFDDRAEFVVKMSAGTVPSASSPTGAGTSHRFASVGVAQVGTNLTESFVTSGKPSRWYKALPGATVDGINENGVACNINVVDGDPQTSGWHTTGDLHPLAAIRWALDNGTSAGMVASNLAARIAFPQGWTQNFHYMIADEAETYIVENGAAYTVPSASSPTGALPALTNFRLYGDPKDTTGEGQERYIALTNGANITSQWWTLTYTANGYRASDLPGITGEALTQLFNYWENNPRESHRGEAFGDKVWWQSIHTSIYDLTNRTLRVAVQETDDWYVFAVPSSASALASQVSVLESSKADKATKVNGHSLSNDVTITASDVNAIGNSGDNAVSREWRLSDVLGYSLIYWNYYTDAWTFDGVSESANFATEASTLLQPGGNVRARVSDSSGAYRLEFYDDEDSVIGETALRSEVTGKRDLTDNVAVTNTMAYFPDPDTYQGRDKNSLVSITFTSMPTLREDETYVACTASVMLVYNQMGMDYQYYLDVSSDGYFDPDSYEDFEMSGMDGAVGNVRFTVHRRLAASASNPYVTADNALDMVESVVAAKAAKAEDVRTLNLGYQRLYSFSTGATNANISVTNYPPTAAEAEGRTHYDPHDPDLDFSTVPASMRIDETRAGEKRTVVDTRDWPVWYFGCKLPRILAAAQEYAHAAYTNALAHLSAWADRTARGLENPAGESTLVIDVPNIWLMTDQTFEKHVSGANSCWVIRSKNAAISPNVTTNGFLELTDAFGTPYIRFNKTEATFADPPASGIYHDDDAGEWVITYETATRPRGGANLALAGSPDYPGKAILKAEDDELCPAVITWTGASGHWLMHAKPKPIAGADPDRMFFGAVIEVEGQDYIEYLKPVSFSHIVMPNGKKIAPDVPAGASVGDTVSWKVVQ